MEQRQTITVVRADEITRSSYGYGGSHARNAAAGEDEDILTFDSGRMPIDPTAAFVTNLPGAKENVRVRVYYTLSKFPIK
jgi:hypothetical protein